MNTKTIFRNPKIKQTASERYAAALGFTAREQWQKKHGITVGGMTRVCDEFFLSIDGETNIRTVLKKLKAVGLGNHAQRDTWGGTKYLFLQHGANGELLGNVVLTRYHGAGFSLSVNNHFAHGNVF